MIKKANTDKEIEACFDVMAELRSHLISEEFLGTVRSLQKDGYILAYLDVNAEVVAVAGYRFGNNLFMGKHLYVDDLVTSAKFRFNGYGKMLLDWLQQEALKNSCKVLHLDSGTHRGTAHKFYFNQGLTIASYHFSRELI